MGLVEGAGCSGKRNQPLARQNFGSGSDYRSVIGATWAVNGQRLSGELAGQSRSLSFGGNLRTARPFRCAAEANHGPGDAQG